VSHPQWPAGETTLEEVRAWRGGLRASGVRLAFTNGCFDLLHAGHVRLLAAARASAGALLVALNDDASVRRLKGAGRPLVPQSERAELLLALECVDRVVLFGADTPLETILEVEPDLLVKGADWTEEHIVGAREVRAAGGEVVRVPLVDDVSTSAIVKRILERYGPPER
jgi:rfaE bifunctional protein nucleotidyltransferase chain/domain